MRACTSHTKTNMAGFSKTCSFLFLFIMSSSVAILGGGISGLSAAYYLSKASPKTKILLIEGSKRVGGWIRSQRVPPGYHSSPPTLPSDPNNVLFEVGPRSLRPVGPGGAAILSMVNNEIPRI